MHSAKPRSIQLFSTPFATFNLHTLEGLRSSPQALQLDDSWKDGIVRYASMRPL